MTLEDTLKTDAQKLEHLIVTDAEKLEVKVEDIYQRHFGSLQAGQWKHDIAKFYDEIRALLGLAPKAPTVLASVALVATPAPTVPASTPAPAPAPSLTTAATPTITS
jgi:hypothetical protein